MLSNENVVKDSIVENIAFDFVEVEYGDFEQLKLAANNFIVEVQKLYDNAIHTSQLIKMSKIKTGLQYFYQYMKNSERFTRQILELQHYFESQVNNFLGRTFYLSWVNEEGHILYLDEAKIGQLYKTKATRASGRGNISKETMQKLNNQDLEKSLQDRFQKSENLRKHVFKIAVARWQANRDKENNPFWANKYYSTFWWRNESQGTEKWGHSRKIPNKGTIAQGYVGAVINEDEKVTNVNIQSALKYLYENHIELNSIPAIVKGDVVWNQNGNIQFAVKEGSFSTARFGQYFNVALNIRNMEKMSVEDFKKELPKMVKTYEISNNILLDIFNKTQNQINQEVGSVAPLV